MNRALLRSAAFLRAAKKIVKKNAELVPRIETALEMLANDALDPRLRTHKLSGELAGSWACSVSYDLRIIFSFVEHNEAEAILLETIGTHDEVY
jgi:addiction module RelE/StbE family toxin